VRLPGWMRVPEAASADGEMSLTEHLGELRVRIIRSFLSVVLGAVLVIAFYDSVLGLMLRPYRNLCERKGAEFCVADLYALGPLEGFSTRMRIGMWGGVILAMPVLLWQIWRFVVPALHSREKRYAVPFVISSVVLFLLGGALAYFTIDRALEFLIGWAGADVQEAFQVSRYVSLVGLMVAAFGIGFLFPVLLVFLQLVGVISPRQLLSGWRIAVMAVFVIAAVITPSGDPVSLLLLSVPMALFFFIAVIIGFLIERRRRRAGVT
jgi:sec-independent protein translocase protein TatC